MNDCTHPNCPMVNTIAEGDKKFFIVWSPQVELPVKCKSYEEAERISTNLAERHPSNEFFILIAIAATRYKKVEIKKLI